jgi:integrase
MTLLNGPDMPQTDTVRYSKRTILELYALGFYTGARISEIANRAVGDVEKIRGGYMLHIRTGKTDESPRSIPIVHPIPVAILKRRIGGRTEAKAQLFEEFIPGGPNGSLAWYAGKAMGRYRDKVELGTATDTHSTRRNLITSLRTKGHDKMLVQFYVGHKPEGITDGIYAKPTQSGLMQIARAIRYPARIERGFMEALGN